MFIRQLDDSLNLIAIAAAIFIGVAGAIAGLRATDRDVGTLSPAGAVPVVELPRIVVTAQRGQAYAQLPTVTVCAERVPATIEIAQSRETLN